MFIKRFEGPSMADVVRQVRSELGPDAIVLDHRARPAGRGWLGKQGTQVIEVTAAIDRDHRPAPPGPERRKPDETWRPLQLTRALIQPLEDEIRALRAEMGEARGGGADPTLAREIADLRRIAERGLTPPSVDVAPSAEPFLRGGLRPRHAEMLGQETERRIASGETATQARLSTLTDQLEARLAVPRTMDAPHQLVVGAPGVGKTTAVAKEADRCPVAAKAGGLKLLSADTSQPESGGRLRRVAKEMGVGFGELRELDALRAEMAHRTTVFVDTPGFVSSDHEAVADLVELRRAMGPRTEVKLVLSATTKESDLCRQLEATRPLDPDVLVFTRIDETRDLRDLVNFLLEPGAPRLAWLGAGAAISGGMIVPDARELAQSVLEEGQG
jgi:flagellar biosynthesis protein FlhF